MRRKDREMGREFALEVIDGSRYGIVSMVDEENKAYGIPLSIVRDENTLYFHSAKDGKKVNIFSKSPRVSIAFVGQVEVPENYIKEELDEMVKDPSKAKLLISNVFTTQFESTLIRGKVEMVEAENEKIKAMKLICHKYTPTKMDYFDMAIRVGLPRTNVYKLEIEEISSKRKKYDISGEEMKWGREI